MRPILPGVLPVYPVAMEAAIGDTGPGRIAGILGPTAEGLMKGESILATGAEPVIG